MSAWKLKLGIEKKKKSEPTPKEIEEWNVSVADSFALWLADTVRNRSDKSVTLVQPVVFKVEPDISGEYSFSFQKFVDKLYDR